MQSQCSARGHSAGRKARDQIVSRSATCRSGGFPIAPSLLELMEELLQSIEQRDAGDPDAPAWEAGARIQRLEEELARRLHEADVERGAVAAASPETRRPDEAFAGIA